MSDTHDSAPPTPATTWPIILGALMMVLGGAAISLPLATSFAFTVWIGWLLVGNGLLKLIYALQTRDAGQFSLKLLLALLYLGAGTVLVVRAADVNPAAGQLFGARRASGANFGGAATLFSGQLGLGAVQRCLDVAGGPRYLG